MHITHLRKVGGSVMLALPPASLERLDLKPGAAVGVDIEGGRLVIEPAPRPRYTLAELLANSDYAEPLTPEGLEWVHAPPVGKEIW